MKLSKIPHGNIKNLFFLCFQEVEHLRKWNIGLQLVKVILNNFLNGCLMFTCSYQQAELYSVGLQYAVNGI